MSIILLISSHHLAKRSYPKKSFNMLNMKPQLVLYTNRANEDNNWPSRFSKQPDTEIKAGMNNKKNFN